MFERTPESMSEPIPFVPKLPYRYYAGLYNPPHPSKLPIPNFDEEERVEAQSFFRNRSKISPCRLEISPAFRVDTLRADILRADAPNFVPPDSI